MEKVYLHIRSPPHISLLFFSHTAIYVLQVRTILKKNHHCQNGEKDEEYFYQEEKENERGMKFSQVLCFIFPSDFPLMLSLYLPF